MGQKTKLAMWNKNKSFWKLAEILVIKNNTYTKEYIKWDMSEEWVNEWGDRLRKSLQEKNQNKFLKIYIEKVTLTYIHYSVKQIASGKLLYNTGSTAWYSLIT